jgi:hypothetical protein
MAERELAPATPILTVQPQREPNGHFAKGNTLRMTHGLRCDRAAEAQLPGQEQLAALLPARRAAILAELGGLDTAIARDEVDRYLRLVVLGETIWNDLAQKGVLTAKGKRRAALNAFLAISDRIDRLTNKLGIERKAKAAGFAERLACAMKDRETAD